MENVVLVIHLLLALALIGVVLVQRSEGGGLSGGGGTAGGRPAVTGMGKLTWVIAGAFIVTSLALTIIAARNSSTSSVLDRLMDAPTPAAGGATPDLGAGSLLPPSANTAAPLVPAAPNATPAETPAPALSPEQESAIETTAPAAEEAVILPGEAAEEPAQQ